jgi:hypothetical protein
MTPMHFRTVLFVAVLAASPLRGALAASTLHLHVGQTVYATESQSIGFALCETPEGAKPYTDGFPKPQLDANGVPKTLFSYKAGDPLKVVAVHNYTWTYDGNANAEKLWSLETRDHHRFCVRDAQVDMRVRATP